MSDRDLRQYQDRMMRPMRPCPLEDLRPYVVARRADGVSWSNIARMTGRPECELRAKFETDL